MREKNIDYQYVINKAFVLRVKYTLLNRICRGKVCLKEKNHGFFFNITSSLFFMFNIICPQERDIILDEIRRQYEDIRQLKVIRLHTMYIKPLYI